ncbi:response regulator [Roseobacter sp.]|uniref:response regulator n=1 Tax=Roseobacter sp. TaxID=1907202 RepID=UPI00385BAB7C
MLERSAREQKFLVVDGDQQVAWFMEGFFKRRSNQPATTLSAAKQFKILKAESFDLIVQGLILPDTDRFELAKRIRSKMETLLIMLTARDEVCDRNVRLKLSADDYVTKPHKPRELLADFRSVMRRYKNGHASPKAFQKFVL